MESLLYAVAHYVTLAVQAIAIAVVVIGSARAVVGIARSAFGRHPDRPEPRAVWLEYARWLVAALTFQLAADIVETSFSPTWDELGRLAVVAVVRTFLSYFLDREVDHNATLLALKQAGARSQPSGAPPTVPPGDAGGVPSRGD